MIDPSHGPVNWTTGPFDLYEDTKKAIDRLWDWSADDGANFHIEGHDNHWKKVVDDVLGKDGSILRPPPQYEVVAYALSFRATSTCGAIIAPIIKTLGPAMQASKYPPDENYNDLHDGGLAENSKSCKMLQSLATDFSSAMKWQEGIESGKNGGSDNPQAKCGWEALPISTLHYPDAQYDMHAHFHWSVIDVIANYYAIAKSIQDSYRVNGHEDVCKYPLERRSS